MVIVSYYTKNTPYKTEVGNLVKTLNNYNIKFKIYEVLNLGKWELNCAQKSSVIKYALTSLKTNILYVDSDARILRDPPFNEIESDKPGFCIWENPWGKRNRPAELLSGTIYFPYNQKSIDVLNSWIEAQKSNKMVWDQKALQSVYRQFDYQRLDLKWCFIRQGMKLSISDPVIEHLQKSRKYKKLI